MKKVDFVNLKRQYATISMDILKNVTHALLNGSFMGSESFEEKFARFHNRKCCVGVGSGTDALWLTLKAYGIGPGDQVIVPANTYIATAFAVSHTGATPVFIDPDPSTYVINATNIMRAMTPENPRVRAIIPVHLYGQPAPMEEIMVFAKKHNLIVIEDCAQSIGASIDGIKTGSWGHAGCFSFYPTKNLGGLAQGGAVVTDDENVARIVRELGNVGRTEGSWFDYSHIGFNSRLDHINAVFLERCLDEVENWNELRRAAALKYTVGLGEISELVLPPLPNTRSKPVYHLFEIKCKDKNTRDELKAFLTDRDVACSLHYPIPCHKQPVYNESFCSCPVSDDLADRLLSLPMHPFLINEEIFYVCQCIKEFFGGNSCGSQ